MRNSLNRSVFAVSVLGTCISGCSRTPATSKVLETQNTAASGGACDDLSQRISKVAINLPKEMVITNENHPSSISSDTGPMRAVTLAPTTGDIVYMTWTDTAGSSHLTKTNAATGDIITDQNLGGIVVRDIKALGDGVAMLYFSGSSFGVRKVDGSGKTIFDSFGKMVGTFSQMWHVGSIAVNNDKIATYFGVSGNQGWNTGHEGDAFKVISATSGDVVNGGWDWGCSHSIDMRVVWVNQSPVRLCLSDVYPNPGFNIDNGYLVQSVWGTHSGLSGGRMGGFVGMGNSLYMAFNKSEGYGYAETTEIKSLTNTAPYSVKKHYSLGTDVAKSSKLAKIARLGQDQVLVGWSYEGETATVIQQLNSELSRLSNPTRVEDSLSLAHSDFQTMENGDVIWAARDMTSKPAKLMLQRVKACN